MKRSVRARTKVSKNGRIMGRPLGDTGPRPVKVDLPVMKTRLTAKAPPKAVVNLETGESAAAHGPPRPIYEQREGAKGRWGQTTGDETLWTIRALNGRGRRGYAKRLAEELGLSEEAVKRKLTSTRAEIRARSATLARPPKVPSWISDIPEKP